MAILNKSPAKAKPLVIPTLVDASPAYAALLAKKLELEDRRGRIETEIKGIERGRAPQAVSDMATKERAARAAALLGDIGDDIANYKLPPIAVDLTERLATLREELGDVETALSIIKSKLPPAAVEASRLVCEAIRDDYLTAIRRTALALAPAIAAYKEFQRITGELNDKDVRWSGRLPQPTHLRRGFGEVWERDSVVHLFINDAIMAGVVTAAEIKELSNYGA